MTASETGKAVDTGDALIEAGRRSFASHGYAGTRLATIASDAGVTTGAFYRRFASKADFFHTLFLAYSEDLQSALATEDSLALQVEACILVARRHRGVIRADMEVLQHDSAHAVTRHRLRGVCAGLLVRHLQPRLEWRAARGAALLLIDLLDQYTRAEAVGWIKKRDAAAVAGQVVLLVDRGFAGT